jgi:hypothetical protein
VVFFLINKKLHEIFPFWSVVDSILWDPRCQNRPCFVVKNLAGPCLDVIGGMSCAFNLSFLFITPMTDQSISDAALRVNKIGTQGYRVRRKIDI